MKATCCVEHRGGVFLLLTRKSESTTNGQWAVGKQQFHLFCWNDMKEDVHLLWDWSCAVFFFLGDRYPTHLAGVQRCHYSDVDSNQDNTIMGILSSRVCRWTATHAHVARDQQQQQQQQKPNLKEIIRKEAKWHKQRKGANISVLRLHTVGQSIFMQQKYTKHLVSGFVQLIYQYLCSRSTGPPPTWVSQGATMAVRSLASEE